MVPLMGRGPDVWQINRLPSRVRHCLWVLPRWQRLKREPRGEAGGKPWQQFVIFHITRLRGDEPLAMKHT
ncbi:hypothetical protein EYF80_036635 [Liparis tanakae]|uniref:Uncharacterized protein n=1 Tax=Liparis tanakae TaxID=230148 RepID=A0A4Z2GK61_9TELE|nr:hypothetical protein EYF80_036635 [Liparis tanakae]